MDTIWDIGNVVYDLVTGDKCALAMDLLAVATPYVPAGITKLPKAVNAAKGVDPSTIRFTQSSVGNMIDTPNGKRPLRKLVKDLTGGRTSADDLPPIRVFDNNGVLTTLDNRRLKAFQVAGEPINTVPATAKQIANDAFKFSSKNGGTSVKVRSGGL